MICLSLFTLFFTLANGLETEWEQFTLFQKTFSKIYDDIHELELRFQIFKENLNQIKNHNSDSNKTFTMGINQFADLTPDEFKPYIEFNSYDKRNAFDCDSFISDALLPESMDWRKHGAVTPIKDQGQCGSCWAFSATGAMEGTWAIQTGQLLNLSVQELVDCAGLKYGSDGCNGGQMEGAFKFMIENGQCGDDFYPYTATDTKSCQICQTIVQASSCYSVTPNDQISLKVAVTQQPVAIAIEADSRYFQFYQTGILTSSDCGTELDHGVLIVGYGEENGQKYWIVKNSWGTSWGESGYIRIGRSESKEDMGICGIAMEPYFIAK
jgi:C1A family cysteine protease